MVFFCFFILAADLAQLSVSFGVRGEVLGEDEDVVDGGLEVP
jgi:hypothetical protein